MRKEVIFYLRRYFTDYGKNVSESFEKYPYESALLNKEKETTKKP